MQLLRWWGQGIRGQPPALRPDAQSGINPSPPCVPIPLCHIPVSLSPGESAVCAQLCISLTSAAFGEGTKPSLALTLSPECHSSTNQVWKVAPWCQVPFQGWSQSSAPQNGTAKVPLGWSKSLDAWGGRGSQGSSIFSSIIERQGCLHELQQICTALTPQTWISQIIPSFRGPITNHIASPPFLLPSPQ